MDSKSVAREFGRVVRKLREESGVSQEAFADEVGIHRTSMGLIERGKSVVGLYTAFRVAGALKTDLADIIRRMDV